MPDLNVATRSPLLQARGARRRLPLCWRRRLLPLVLALWLATGILGSAPHAWAAQSSPHPEHPAGHERPGLALNSPSPTPTSSRQPHARGYLPPPVDLSHLEGNWRPGPQLASLPERWDWRDHGAVTYVQDQGACGSCYAFGTLASFESQLLIAGEGTYDLSEKHAAQCNYEALHVRAVARAATYGW